MKSQAGLGMKARFVNPVRHLKVVVLAGFIFSACGTAIDEIPTKPEVASDLGIPGVAISSNTPEPSAARNLGGTVVPDEENGAQLPHDGTYVAPSAVASLTATVVASPTFVSYFVQPGDWFYKIAHLFNTTAQELLDANPGVNPGNLQVGQELLVPGSADIVSVSTEEVILQESGFAPPPPELQSVARNTFGNSLPLQLEIPVIGIEAQVVPVGWHAEEVGGLRKVLWHTPGEAAGFLVSSTAPGQGGNAVFYGHHNIHGNVFRGLDRLRLGDTIRVFNSNSILDYRVESVDVFPERDASAQEKLSHMDLFDDTNAEQLTILTCWPFETNTHRVVVVAKPE